MYDWQYFRDEYFAVERDGKIVILSAGDIAAETQISVESNEPVGDTDTDPLPDFIILDRVVDESEGTLALFPIPNLCLGCGIKHEKGDLCTYTLECTYSTYDVFNVPDKRQFPVLVDNSPLGKYYTAWREQEARRDAREKALRAREKFYLVE